MGDISELSAIVQSVQAGRDDQVLATLVRVEGSSYRSVGARMLISKCGNPIGSVSAGCLEAEIREHAFEWAAAGPHIVTFEIGSMEDTVLGWGSGCRGTLHVLLEPVSEALRSNTVWAELERCISERHEAVLATVTQTGETLQVGRLLVAGAEVCGNLPEPLRSLVLQDATEVAATKSNMRVRYEGSGAPAEALFEAVTPPLALVVFGGDSDVSGVVNIAAELGWTITLCDKRPVDARSHRSRAGVQVCQCFPGEFPEGLRWDGRTAALVMTHHFADDLAIVEALLAAGVSYIGVLGGQERSRIFREELSKTYAPEALRNIRAPAGLDLGADSAAEIALSITSEILAVFKGRDGRALMQRGKSNRDSLLTRVRNLESEPIHA